MAAFLSSLWMMRFTQGWSGGAQSLRFLFVVNLESEVRGQREGSPGTQLPWQTQMCGAEAEREPHPKKWSRGFLEGVGLGEKKREKEVGVERETRIDVLRPTTHTTAGTLQPSWRWRYRKARTMFPGIGFRATERQQSSASLAPPWATWPSAKEGSVRTEGPRGGRPQPSMGSGHLCVCVCMGPSRLQNLLEYLQAVW